MSRALLILLQSSTLGGAEADHWWHFRSWLYSCLQV